MIQADDKGTGFESDASDGIDEEEPFIIIQPSSGWRVVDISELWRYRDLLTALAIRDLKLRYRQTALGAAWVILQPLIAAGIFSFVFGNVAKLPSDGLPYFVFAYAGLLCWNVFSTTLTKASGSLVQNSQLISKVYFPRIVVPLATVFSSLIDFLVAFAMMVVLMVIYHIPPHPAIFLLPLWVLLSLLLSIGCGLFASALMVTYRDVQYVIPVLVQFLLYASPVAYSVATVPRLFTILYKLNPMCGLLEAFRWSIIGKGKLDLTAVIISVLFAIIAVISGSAYFRQMERRFADVI